MWAAWNAAVVHETRSSMRTAQAKHNEENLEMKILRRNDRVYNGIIQEEINIKSYQL